MTGKSTSVTLSVVAVLTALYGILFFIVRHADSIIRNQYEQQRRIEQSLRHVTTHDALTNLPNRLLLLDRIKQSLTSAERNNSLLAVAFIDLDNFQNINNSLGHEIGDQVLQTVAHRLAGCVRESDTIARIGGDEFVVSVPDIQSNADLFQIAKKMLDAIALPIEVGGRELHLTASIGIALYPEHGKDAETLMRKADMAMHSAKRLGRNRHQMFVEHMSEEVRQQVQLEDEMWRALENNEFVLYYQPVIDLKSGAIIGAEALLRWPNAHGTWLSPAEFIPKTEKCGLIVPLSEWVLSEACTQLQAWRESGNGLGQFTMSVNLSSSHFSTPGLATMIAGVIEQAEIDPKLLHLEITDGLLKNPNESILANFEGLKRIGIKFTLDDFGTGYSSLGYLRSFPIDLLKIDRTFIHGLPDNADNAAIVTTIISLANSLDLTVVAKGVETAATTVVPAAARLPACAGIPVQPSVAGGRVFVAGTGTARHAQRPAGHSRLTAAALPVFSHAFPILFAHPRELRNEIRKNTRFDRGADFAHQLLVVMQVVDGIEARTEYLVEAVQMVQVGAGEVAAGVAGALLVQRTHVHPVLRILDLDVAEAGEQHAVARIARRHHAVEHVDALRDRLHDVFRRAHAHQVARLVLRQLRRGVPQNAQHVFLGLAHRQAADGITVETDTLQFAQRFIAQMLVHPALHDAEQRIRIAFMRGFRALRPAQRQAHRLRRRLLVRRIRRAFVEDHHDVGIQHLLDAHGFFRRQETFVAVHRRLELHSLLGDLAQRAQAEHLKTAGIGQDRPIPAHEAMQAAMRRDHFQPRPQPQVEGVAQHDLRADLFQFERRHRLDRAIGADRHEGRGFDAAVGKLQRAATGKAVGFMQGKFHCFLSISIASP